MVVMDKATAHEIIDGSLLGDAGLVKKYSRGNPYFWIDLSGEEHIDWLHILKTSLLSMGVSVTDKCPKITPRISTLRGKTREYKEVALWSSCSPLLLPFYLRWYPYSKKVVPTDLQLTPLVIAHWFMGDGSSWWMSGRPNLVRVKFCTNSLPLSNIDWLANQLNNKRGIIAIRYKSSPVLFINDAASVSRLMKMIEPHLVPSFSYKVKYPTLKRLK